MKKLAIFDLDGTLVSSLKDITKSINEAFEYFEINSITEEQCMNALGHGARSLVIKCLEYAGYNTESKTELEEIINKYNQTYGNSSNSNTIPFDGILDMLKNIRIAGYKTAIVSNKPHAFTLKMSEDLFSGLIDLTFGQSELFPKKPDPSIIYHTLSKLGFDKCDSIYIGDSDVDVMTAKNSGLSSIAVSWGYRSRDILESSSPDYIVDSVEDLEKILYII
ncbi:HAD family hydrolase [Proteocatella sphenisci]|uniref:HAD family hydrolase n=1 Tax=Proteocatella sphenisci TaxID=181070 RepID=UPI00048B1637|nr:HAD family hydrolase [Proteocatella sphenisci]